MVRVQVNKKRHLVALFLTLSIVIIGLLSGLLITYTRTSYISDINKQQKLEYDSLQLQYLYIISLLKPEGCSVSIKILEENINKLENARTKLESYIAEGKQKEFDVLKRDYILAEIRYWLLAKQIKEECHQDSILLLFFYTSSDNCYSCILQGDILTTLKNKFKDKLLIFSLDAGFEDEPMINLLKQSYNITALPSLVVGDKVYSNLIKEKQLFDIFCSYPTNLPNECKNA